MAGRDPWAQLRRDLRAQPEATGPLPERISRFPILAEIGRTASSIVYLAKDPELDRKVALKVLREERTLPDFIHRFRREGTIAASLRHPNLITVHEAGLWRNREGHEIPFIAMDYVPGGTLGERRLSPREAAEALVVVAEAVEHAHRGGIVHRDLKPGNILIDAAGKPVVTDFGLAKAVERNSVQTYQGSILGTPQYMAPEQVRGEKADPRTDVYALGAILYELLAGGPPFSEPNTAALFDRILRGEVRPIVGGPQDLEAVALKALAKDPARRYPSAGEFAAELRRFLAGKPTLARPVSTVRRVLRQGHVQRILAGAGMVAIVICIVLGVQARKALRFREAIVDAARWEAKGDPWKARDAFRLALDLDPEHPGAKAGFARLDAELRSAAPPEGSPESLPKPWGEFGTSGSAGGISGTPADSSQPSLALDAAGLPIVAWREITKNSPIGVTADIYLRRWDGRKWVEFVGSATGGGVSNSIGSARFPTVAADARGGIVVAWDDPMESSGRILVRRWDGTSWSDLGGSALVSDRLGTRRGGPSVALDAAGHPVVVWQEESDGRYAIDLRRWNGKAWIAGDRIPSARSCHYPTVALTEKGEPVVAWLEEAGPTCEARVSRWDGKAWIPFDGLNATVFGRPMETVRCSLALTPEGHPVLAWIGNHRLYLKAWNGRAWEELRGSATEQGLAPSAEIPTSVSLALDARGRPTVAWSARSNPNPDIFLRRWDGSAWVDLAGSGSGGGLSRTWGNSFAPALRLDATGNPVVAWIDGDQPNNNDIYVRRFLENPPTGLRQLHATGAPIRAGAPVTGPVTFSAALSSVVPNATCRLEVEVQPVGVPFTGLPTPDPSRLAPGPKRWQARTIDSLGMVSGWVDFGGRGIDEADFVVVP